MDRNTLAPGEASSAARTGDARPYLPPGATVLVGLLKQAAALPEAIFTRFPAAGSAPTNVPVEQLVGGALRHRRPPAEGLRTQSCPTCVTLHVQSRTSRTRKRTKRPPTLRWVCASLPEVHAPSRLCPPMASSHAKDRLLKRRSRARGTTIWL